MINDLLLSFFFGMPAIVAVVTAHNLRNPVPRAMMFWGGLVAVICVALVQQGMFGGEAPQSSADTYTFLLTHLLPVGLKGLVIAAMLAAAIDGVGEKKAVTIVRHRETHGPFGRVEDLAEVKGIGSGTVERNRHNLMVAPVAPEGR